MTKIIDLSLPVDLKTMSPPSQARRVDVEYAYRKPGWWQASSIILSSHTATHVDSPLHVIEKTEKIGEIDLDRVTGEGIVLNLTNKGANSSIASRDLQPFDRKVRSGDIVVLRTDWTEKMWGTKQYWNDSPYLTEDGARWLVKKRPKALGFDFFEEYSARLENFKPCDFVIHKIILGAGIVLIEGLCNLRKISRERVKIYALPLKLMMTEAAPARAIAIEE